MRLLALIASVLMLATPAAAEFTISFEWGDIPSCTSGRPNRVDSPSFVLRGVPEGTTEIAFKLVDRNVPSFNHGGGRVKVGQNGRLPTGVFKYKSPCPPDGVHLYEWRATAKAGRKALATATAQRNYPE